jgi:hypothetical protein
MAANVTVKTTGRIATVANLAVVKVSVDANSVSYATSLGGLAIDLYNMQQVAGPPEATINANDIVGILPLSQSTPGGFWPTNLAVGTQTSTTLPCYVKLIGTGSANSAGYGEIVDGACTQVFTAFIVLARGGQN